ncbi:MAG TPA: succinyl-diaminopimelate desuccinylase [Rhizomicrobium sp.]
MDPIALAQDLIRCPSVTPEGAGALGVLEAALKPLGFTVHRLRFETPGTAPVENLYARRGATGPNFCFAGHTDVVPPGDVALWRHDPFAAKIENGILCGRGAADMKSAIAAFVAACARHSGKGSISLLITGDEEGPGINGTIKLLGWLRARGEKIDHCLVGEPTAVARAGDTIKIGRRGSMNSRILVRGMQGHVGYPHAARNPIPALAALVTRLVSHRLDDGTAHFDPSTLSFTTVDVGNATTNVIPAEACAGFNIRFNDKHTAQSLQSWLQQEAQSVAKQYDCAITLEHSVSGDAFVTKPGKFTSLVADTVKRVTGAAPEFSTSGGTSDARFIKDFCPVVELGLAGSTMHKTDEGVPVAEIHALTDIYAALLDAYFETPL